MTPEQRDFILQACAASSLCAGATIQSLWSGYGEIVRVHLQGCRRPSVILKHVKFPEEAGRPGGGNTDRSHRRKVRSYQVETNWYQNFSTDDSCRIPACLAACSHGDEMLIVLEDLDVAGFDGRRTSVKEKEIRACLGWLAHFHALFLGVEPEGLWPVGTYWHLETRPDELEAMDDAALKAAAADIDRTLSQCRFKTIVHGDAKLANFCFSPSGQEVAAVDFQYVGGGCGMKDVAYFLGSCMDERECERRVPGLLEHYFLELRGSMRQDVDADALEKEWREMFAFAWTDFHRFLLGWMPGHWKINRYSKQLTREVLCKIQNQKQASSSPRTTSSTHK
uniref:Protein kinase-like domain containing n=1 Tax=Oryzias latipes TaxID=8090 RepID=A0A3P9JIN6_ORYLA